MKKIAFICSWGENSENLRKRYGSQTPNYSGSWDNVCSVDNVDDADIIIVVEDSEKGYDHSKLLNKAIILRREPRYLFRQNYNYNQDKNVFHYDNGYCPSVWWVKKSYDELKLIKNNSSKKRLCCIMSGKEITEGHVKRLEFVKKIDESDIEIDIYGRNLSSFNLSKYRGECVDKYEVLSNYDYSLAFENGSIENYFSEKLADTFLSWNMPIYWGCRNLSNFFDGNSFHFVDIYDHESSINNIREIIKNRPTLENLSSLEDSRNKILDVYNLWPSINRIIKTGKMFID